MILIWNYFIASLPLRQIYNKDKYLDKSQYKPSEDEYKYVYYKNLLERDDLDEEERKRLNEEFQQYQDKLKNTQQNSEERKFIDVDKIK